MENRVRLSGLASAAGITLLAAIALTSSCNSPAASAAGPAAPPTVEEARKFTDAAEKRVLEVHSYD